MSTLLESRLNPEQKADAMAHDTPMPSAFQCAIRQLRCMQLRNVSDLQILLDTVEHVVTEFELDARLNLSGVLAGIEQAKAAEVPAIEPEPRGWYRRDDE